MRRTIGAFGALTALVAAFGLTAGAAQAQMSSDPFAGVWKLNVEQSVYMPGPRPPADLVNLRQYSDLSGGWKRYIDTGTNAQGNVTFQIGVYKLDGARHPVEGVASLTGTMSGGRAPTLTRSYRVIDERTVESITYTDGVAGLPVVRQIAPDGMSFVQTVRGTNAQGVEVLSVTLWERVR